MNAHGPTRRRAAGLWAAALVAALALVPIASAQQLTGGIYGKVVDEQGGALPGVTVTLSGIGAPKIQTSDARGEFRFPSLDPGVYTLTYDLQSFTKVTNNDVKVSVGQNTNTTATLKISSVEATVVVEGAPALLDTRQVETGAVVDQTQLAADPDGARSLGHPRNRPGRPARPRQRRRQRERPAVDVRRQGQPTPPRTPGTWTASPSRTWAPWAPRPTTTTSIRSRRCRPRPAAATSPRPRRASSSTS